MDDFYLNMQHPCDWLSPFSCHIIICDSRTSFFIGRQEASKMGLSAVFCPVDFLVTFLSWEDPPSPNVFWEDGDIKKLGGFSFENHLVLLWWHSVLWKKRVLQGSLTSGIPLCLQTFDLGLLDINKSGCSFPYGRRHSVCVDVSSLMLPILLGYFSIQCKGYTSHCETMLLRQLE